MKRLPFLGTQDRVAIALSFYAKSPEPGNRRRFSYSPRGEPLIEDQESKGEKTHD